MRISVFVILVICLGSMLGCGGGSGGSNPSAPFVNIESFRVVPKITTIAAGDAIQWVNADAAPHQIVSGVLDPRGNPLVVHLINIGITGFEPTVVLADLGDTIRFNNLTGTPFTMNIVNDNGQVVSTVVFGIGDMKTVVFPGAGLFTFRKQGSNIFQGSLTLFGQPHPDNQFQSQIMPNGDVFTKQFNARGAFPYFVQDLNNPNNSFITGTINVQ